MIRAGFVIPATMISGINSDLPGQVMAQVSQNVYDTATGKYLLIPQGTRLIGAYSSDVAFGQERVLMAWQRLIFPDGKALDIRAMPGADSAGYAGFSDKVNSHWFRTISSAVLMSGVIAAVDMSQNDRNSDSNNDRQRASDSLSEALGQTLGQTLSQIITKTSISHPPSKSGRVIASTSWSSKTCPFPALTALLIINERYVKPCVKFMSHPPVYRTILIHNKKFYIS